MWWTAMSPKKYKNRGEPIHPHDYQGLELICKLHVTTHPPVSVDGVCYGLWRSKPDPGHDLTPDEQDQVGWLMNGYGKPTREEAEAIVRVWRTELYQQLSIENFGEQGSDYGYGGEVVDTIQTDHMALWKWITEREKRLLDGFTLEEFVKMDWRFE